MATLLGMENPEKFTFHLLRCSSATEAANQGATTAQMTFGTFWVGLILTFINFPFQNLLFNWWLWKCRVSQKMRKELSQSQKSHTIEEDRQSLTQHFITQHPMWYRISKYCDYKQFCVIPCRVYTMHSLICFPAKLWFLDI